VGETWPYPEYQTVSNSQSGLPALPVFHLCHPNSGATMHNNLAKELAYLGRLTVGQLRARYCTLFGEATRAGNKSWLIKRIAWRLQALAEGDLSERAHQRAKELANDADLRFSPPKSGHLSLLPSTRAVKPNAKHDPRLPPPRHDPPPPLQGRDPASQSPPPWPRVRRQDLSLSVRRRQGHHRLALQRFFVLPP
jgi:hypothetical protein